MQKGFLPFILFFSLISAGVSFHFLADTPFSSASHHSRLLVFPNGNTYEKEWKKVDSLMKKGLTKSALEAVEAIYVKAKKSGNSAQVVKAVIHRIKLESFMEEYSLQNSIDKVKDEIKNSTFPLTPVLHSMLAELYWSYYENNRWKFHQRSQTVNFNLNDISTWDLKTITDHAIKHYRASLQQTDSLQRTKIDLYDAVLIHEDYNSKNKPAPHRKLRPTLYDFLAHRAVDFFINEEPDIIRPAYRFELNSESYFWDFHLFAKLKIENPDSLSPKYHALKILQDLIVFHANDSDPSALVDADLKRLKFVKDKSIIESKDSLYLQALENLEKKFFNHPSSAEVSYKIASVWNERGNRYKPLFSDENKWSKKKAYEKCEEVIRRFPESLGASNCKYLQSQIKAKNLNFQVEQANLPSKPFRALVQYKNVNKVFVRIAKYDIEKFNKEVENLHGEKLIRKFLDAEAVKEFAVDLPDDGDFNEHSVEIKIPELPFGHYVILLATDKSFSYEKNAIAYSACWSTELSSVQRRNNNGGYDVLVLHRETGHPLGEVNAQLWYQKYDYITRKYEFKKGESYTTDENGFVSIPPVGDEYRNYFLELSKGSDRYYSDNGIYLYKYYKPEKRTYLKTIFFTDRTIYRPGQTVYFKGIVLETDGEKNEIKPKQPVTATLYDVNYQKVSSLNLVSNDYGSFSGIFSLPQNLLNGQFSISDGHGGVYFSVEDYKRPRFEVNFNPVKGVYKLNEKITVHGKVQSYAGANISGSQVKYRVVRNASFPHYWHWWRGYFPSSPEMEIANGLTSTNDTGGFVIEFKAIPDLSVSKEWMPIYDFTVYADVTDITGETHSAQNHISVGYNAMKLNVDIGEHVSKDSISTINIYSTNLNGEFEPAKVKITIWKQLEPARLFRKRLWEQPDKHLFSKEEYYSFFPSDVYADEDNKHKWEKGAQVFSGEFDTEKAKSFSISTLPNWQQGAYIMEAVAKDKFGEEVKDVKYFTLYSSASTAMPVNNVDWFSSLKEKSEPGEKVSLLIGSKANDVKVLYEIEHKNEIVKREWMALNNEQKKIEISVEEKHRGNFAYHILFVKNNRVYSHSTTVVVPYTNKELDIEFETFRSKLLPGQKEEWKMKIKGKRGEKITAEMLALMYDASLDAFRRNDWAFRIDNTVSIDNTYFSSLLLRWATYYFSSLIWETSYSFVHLNHASIYSKEWNMYSPFMKKYYDRLNWFGYPIGGSYYYDEMNSFSYRGYFDEEDVRTSAAAKRLESIVTKGKKYKSTSGGDDVNNGKLEKLKNAGFSQPMLEKSGEAQEPAGRVAGKEQPLSQISARKNLNETAFFFPQLQTDENGTVIIKFTTPEALTRWKFFGFAHTKDLMYGQVQKEVVTQKKLMVTPHAPRFFREGDHITFTAKIDNLSAADMNGKAELILYDALTMKEITHKIMLPLHGKFETIGTRNFSAKQGSNASLEWDLVIPEEIAAITYKVVAKSGNFSDGEENTIPVLTNRMLVTESLPLLIRNKQTKTFRFEKFISQNNGSSTLRNHKFTLEFTANPAWYAVQALPYMMEYPYECTEQIFSRFYANAIASHIANSSPKIKAVLDAWKTSSPEAFLSNLQKNQELKSLFLEETPWVLDAKDESERKKRIGLLFDFNRMANELESAMNKLQKMQVSSGGWSWFDGMPDDRYITQHIVTGMGHLDHLGIKKIRSDNKIWNMVKNAVQYLDNRIREDYKWILNHDKENMGKDHLWHLQIQYLYARSYFKDIPVESKSQKAFDYYKEQAQKYWPGKGRYLQGMIALGLHRFGDKKNPSAIMKSLKENSITNEEMGMYWKENYEGFYWYEAPVESHALLIEAFDEVANDKKAVDDLRVWLLKSKQTQNWKSTKATTEAVYALLLRGTDWLATESDVEIYLGNMKIDPKQIPDAKTEAGTGYFKTSWSGSDIKPQMGSISISKKNEGVFWGAVYWQYFEQLDKITPHKTPLQLVKKLFIEKNTASGPVIEPVIKNTKLKPGDKLKVRIELRVDRDMEYVHMKDMRASGFEPVNVFSQYKWQDGLGYYESTRDAATNFFFSQLPKGTYVFEYPLLVSHSGDFSNGITTIQCMYAPEFTSHSEGIRVRIGK